MIQGTVHDLAEFDIVLEIWQNAGIEVAQLLHEEEQRVEVLQIQSKNAQQAESSRNNHLRAVRAVLQAARLKAASMNGGLQDLRTDATTLRESMSATFGSCISTLCSGIASANSGTDMELQKLMARCSSC